MTTLSAAANQKLIELESSAAHRTVVDHLRGLLTDGRDVDCYKINAFRVAAELGVARADAVRTLLYATRLGLFDLNWDIRCPSCGGTPDYHKHLMNLAQRAHCGLCELEWGVDFEDQVEVTFTVNPDVRSIQFKDLRDRVAPDHLEYFKEVGARERRAPYAYAPARPGDLLKLRVLLEPGSYRYEAPGKMGSGGRLTVAGEVDPVDRHVRLSVDRNGAVDVRELRLAPGVMQLEVQFDMAPLNDSFAEWPFVIWREAPPNNWVSAAYLTSLQYFRELFSGEFLAPDTAFAIRSTTLMFTDIRGSTEMYESLGDASAYAVVRDHFGLMTEVIRRHEGGIVKTIGDAVMAAFPVNADAVRAACEIQSELGRVGGRLAGVEVKIGLHRGPTIAVTSNQSLDHFGRTVNVAARVQGKSKPREILLTEAVLNDPAVQAILDEKRLIPESFEAALKGVAGTMKVFSVRPG